MKLLTRKTLSSPGSFKNIKSYFVKKKSTFNTKIIKSWSVRLIKNSQQSTHLNLFMYLDIIQSTALFKHSDDL